MSSVVDVFRARAALADGRPRLIYLDDLGQPAATWSAGELDRRARSVAASLQALRAQGERALLLFPPGLDYVSAFFGCLYAEVIAVPVYPPDPARLPRDLPRLLSILESSGARFVLTLSSIATVARGLLGNERDLTWVATDDGDGAAAPDDWRPVSPAAGSLAFLQYTSGSTASPKGVMVSHANLLDNTRAICARAGLGEEDVGAAWLPPYHDMGLIGAIVLPLLQGFPAVLMSPVTFLQQPFRWLQAISRYRCTISPAPTFAYDLCVRRTTAEQRAELDLSSWRVAMIAAEPVRADTMDRFAAAFAPRGYRRESFWPCYGLAEGTLATAIACGPTLRDAGGRPMVSCGQPIPGHDLRIVDPELRVPCADGGVGEIWLAGPSVAGGYWNQPEATLETFGARLADGAGPYLRTGDLGALRDGEVIITGRIKDLIVIRGRNHYPQDLELTVERSHPALRPGCSAAFAAPREGDEGLVVVSEVGDAGDPQAVMAAMRDAVTREHDVAPDTLILVRARSISKTPSGKIQRRACRAAFLEGSLDVVARWDRPAPRILGPAAEQAIAVVGLACRFPGADGEGAFWRVLEGGLDTITEVPPDRWDIDRLYHPTPGTPGKMSTRHGGFLDGVDRFDAGFFGVSPREAAHLDPQQRLLLETTWSALEDAGLPGERLAGSRTGVFVGIGGMDYSWAFIRDCHLDSIDPYVGTGNAHSVAANRLSYLLDLRGPSMAIDTACSSSLVAVHLACRALRSGEADAALAAGVNLILSPETSIAFSHARMMAPDGRCKTFDAAADGYVRSEGCGVVVLKRLADALADGDRVRGLLLGSAVNQDGRTPGITAPSARAQEACMRAALAEAGLPPAALDYIEAHGTGTALGDPIEVAAIAALFAGAESGERRRCLLGSVKANIGHLETASGIAGLIKVILALEHELIPRQLHFRALNPRIALEGTPLTIPKKPQPWPRGGRARVAGVSSYGFGGTNAHVVIAEPPEPPPPPAPRSAHLLALSAKSAEALDELAARFAGHLSEHPQQTLAEICGSAAHGRGAFAHRLALVAADEAELRQRLGAPGAARKAGAPRIAFLFTGQGAQAAGMGKKLYRAEPSFREALDRCAAVLDPLLDRPLLDLLDTPMVDTAHAQPALVALELALVETWRRAGVEPVAVLGHSVGELAAACVAGVLSFDEALAFAAARGRLMQALPAGGAMAAALTSEAVVRELIEPHPALSIAAVNGPESVVVSGERRALLEVTGVLAARGVRCEPLAVSHAFHSPLLEPMLDGLEAAAARLDRRAPRLPLLSNLSGQALEGPPDATYFRRQAREPVRFMDGVRALPALGVDVFLEIGPGSTLIGMGRRCLPDLDAAWIPSLRSALDDRRALLEAAGAMWTRGAPLRLAALEGDARARRVALPGHPLRRERHWFAAGRGGPRSSEPPLHPLIGHRFPSAQPQAVFQVMLSAESEPWLADHRVDGAVLLPATAFLEMARVAAAHAFDGAPGAVEDLALLEALVLGDAPRRVEIALHPPTGSGATFQVSSQAPDEARWIVHATGRVLIAGEAAPPPRGEAPASLRLRLNDEIAPDAFYARLREHGLEYGAAFRGLEEIRRGDGEALGRLRPPEAREDLTHPALIDAALQLVAAALSDGAGGRALPVGIGRFHCAGLATHAHARLRPPDLPGRIVADIDLLDDDGARVGAIAELALQRLGGAAAGRGDDELLHHIEWIEVEPPAAAGARRFLLLGEGPALAERLRLDGHVAIETGELDGQAGSVDHVVDLRALGAAPEVELAARALRTAQALAGGKTRLTFVTRGAQDVEAAPRPVAPSQATLLGLARVAAVEHPEIGAARIDLDPQPDSDEPRRLAALLAGAGEPEIALRGAAIFAPRLRACSAPTVAGGPVAVPATPAFALVSTRPGSLDALRWRPVPRREPPPGHVELEVRAAGLNFRDVLAALGLYPGDPIPFGAECAGVVASVGAGVDDLAPGDEVVALATGSFANRVLAPAPLTVRKPARLGFAEAATIPVVFATASYGLEHLARLERGERVLIHAAAGGVGLAAVQIARRIGAEIHATAGSDEKRDHLRRLGVEHTYDSRTVEYADRIREVTAGRGVDVVLSSLPGEHIARSLETLGAGGRFVEIGRTDIYQNHRLGLYPFRNNLSYFAVDLERVCRDRPALVRRILDDLMARFAAGELDALSRTDFRAAEIADAFRFMARRKNIGKVVIDLGAARPSDGVVRADATYLVTGGLGALGLAVARALVDRGARHLILLGRAGGDPPAELVEAGARAVVARADVSDARELAAALERAGEGLPPVRGVVHAAGVLEDALLADQTEERLARALAPKAGGAWNLHRILGGAPLDFFVCFSSVAGILGSPGQASYAAASTFLDAFAAHRRRLGLAATTIAWGPWAGPGMARGQADRLARLGLDAIPPAQGAALFARLLDERPTTRVVVAARWPELSRSLGTRAPRLLVELALPGAESTAPAELASMPPETRRSFVEDHVRALLGNILGLDGSRLDADAALAGLGVDSLMAFELKDQVERRFKVKLGIDRLMADPSLRGLIEEISAAADAR